jgi:hypothetical protein
MVRKDHKTSPEIGEFFLLFCKILEIQKGLGAKAGD